ncbi:MAG TPA: hypothetical protein VK745_26255 [Polyangiaceae bacterium]|jgi:hypothetical protein|nr:hypothetical protein [Polyangiaceae bacterium]
MSRSHLFSTRRVTIASLSLLAIAGCSQVIGLGDYKVGDNSADAGNSESGNSSVTAGSANAGASGSTVDMKPDGGAIKPDAGGKAEGGSTSAGSGGEAGEPSGATGGLSEGGSIGVGGTGVGGTGLGGGSAGANVGGGAGAGSACPTGCDDGIPCTIDLCDSTGCVHTPVDALCNGACMKCSATLGCQDKSTTTELLTDGNFDTGSGTGWAQTSTNENTDVADSLVLIKTPPAGVTAQSLPNILALGVKNNEQTFVTQPLIIPANAAALTLTGYVLVKSADTVDGSDQAWIDLITDPADPNTYLDTFSKVWFNEDAGTTWVAISENADMSTIAPSQSVWLTALGLNDVSDISNFYFDSLSVKAKVCTP